MFEGIDEFLNLVTLYVNTLSSDLKLNIIATGCRVLNIETINILVKQNHALSLLKEHTV